MIGRPLSLIGMLAVMLALVSQLALGAVVIPDDPPVAVLCLGDQAPAPGDTAPHRHHAPDLTLCPLSVALALPAIILTPSPVISVPFPVLVLRPDERAPGRGPPPPTARVGAPRAPPVTA